MVVNLKRVSIFIFISLAIWGQSIHLFVIPGIGTLYPLRIILILYLFYCLFANTVIPNKQNRTDRMLLLFFIYATVITLVNKKWDSTQLYYISMITILLLVSCMSRIIKNEKDRIVSLKAIITNSFILYLLAIYENRTSTYLFSSSIPSHYNNNWFGSLQPVLFFGNTNNFCMFFCLTLPCMFLLTKNRIIRLAWTIATMHVALITNCRTGIVLLIGFYTFMVFVRVNMGKGIKTFILCLAVVASAFIVFVNNIDLDVRIYLWINALYNSVRTFLLGTGLGSSRYINAENTVFNIIKGGYFGGFSVGAVHNYLLELLLETGVIGVGILLAWIKIPVKYIFLNKNRVNDFYYLCILLFTAITSICVSTMTQWFQLWIFFPIAFSYAYQGIENKRIKEMQGDN